MDNLSLLEPVDYLVIGHVSQDLTSFSVCLGGTAVYSALTARALGLRVGVVTASGETLDLSALQDVMVISTQSDRSTTFENINTENGRKQLLHHQATSLTFESVPEIWRRSAIIHLGPIAQEIDANLPDLFAPSLLGLTPQGWLRSWDEIGQVTESKWVNAEQALGQAGAVVVSIEDVAGDEEQLEFMASHTRVLVVTEGAAGSRVYWHGDQRRFQAPEVEEVDSTGAGDIYAAAFFIRLQATRDPWESARFATQLAARSVTRTAVESIPTVEEIQACMVEVL
ncbi:MAG: PfkB family carbohydrate kinase [Anaerolineae bacterium]|nr:PfkB family carbohydrate kinase [Anaerolineae bacterium]